MKTLWEFMAALPALLKLFQTLQKRIDEAGVDRKVVQDVKTIHEAFDAKDAEKLNALFSSR